MGYAPYAGGLVYNLNTGATWLVYLGSVTCGLSAGLFWSVEGAIALGCASSSSSSCSSSTLVVPQLTVPASSRHADPDPSQRGIFLAIWLAWRSESLLELLLCPLLAALARRPLTLAFCRCGPDPRRRHQPRLERQGEQGRVHLAGHLLRLHRAAMRRAARRHVPRQCVLLPLSRALEPNQQQLSR